MDYMGRYADLRRDPRLLVPGARSVVCVVLGYNPGASPSVPRIARFAQREEDYHTAVKRRLFRLAALVKERYPDFEARACCDTAPIAEKRWAVRAGLGVVGRHTLLITRRWGTWVNLGELVTTAEFSSYDVPLGDDPCRDCRRCLDACPNQALSSLPFLDARRCTAYHTVESRADTLPDDLDRRGWLFGCDICQLACPCNASAAERPVGEGRLADLAALPDADEARFRRTVRGTNMTRIRFPQWLRNCGRR